MKATKTAGKGGSFEREDAEGRVMDEQKRTTNEINKKTLIQRIARSTARQPKKALLVSFAVSIILSALGPLIAGFELTTDTKGWRSRGTLVANREMQAEVLNLNRFQLFRDEDGSHWKLVTETETGSWIEFSDRKESYADPEATDRTRRLDLKGESLDFKTTFSIERHAGGGTSNRSLDFKDTCDTSWFSKFNEVLFEGNMYAMWKVQPDEDHDATVSSSALDENVLSQICKAEQNTMKILKDNNLCTTCSDGSCLPPHSLVFLLRQKLEMHETSCEELMKIYTSTVQEEFTDELLACTYEYSEKFDAATYMPGDMEVCLFDYLPNVVDANFGKDGNRNVRYTSSFFRTKNDDMEDFLDIYRSFDEADGETVRGVYNFESFFFIDLVAELATNADVLIGLSSLVLTIFALLIHNKSPWLTLIGFLQIIVAIPLSYFGYTVIARIEFFPLLNLIGLFVASAVGADDIFVAVDKWNNARNSSPKEATTEDIAEIALPDAAGAMLLTTITTAVAFFATCICPITPILTFATFCGLLVFFNYILNILIVFPALCQWDIWRQNGSTSRLVYFGNKKQKTVEKVDESVEEGWDNKKSPKIEKEHRIFLSIFNQVDRFRWPLLVACLIVAGVCLYYALQFPQPESMDVRLLPLSHPLELHNIWKGNLLSVDLWKSVAVVQVLFGLESGDTGSQNNPDSLSKLLLDDTFNPSSEEAQLYLRDFCDNLFAKDFAVQLEKCAINEFETWLEEQSSSATPSSAYSNNCNEAAVLPVPESAFDPCIVAWSKETGNISVLQENGKVRVLMITGAVDLEVTSSLDLIATKWNEFESYIGDQIALAPEGVNKFYHASFMWWYWDVSVQMTKTALGAGLITLGFASIVVILSSRSLVLTLVSAVTIFFILVVSSATLVGLGWELGFLESVCFSILIGISCDFVIHFGHAYKHLEGHVDSRLRARFAVVNMGPSILAAAATTVVAASVMLFCSTPFFTKFSTILLVTMLYATIGSFIFYVVLLDLFGPSEPSKMFDLFLKRIVRNKEDEKAIDVTSQTSNAVDTPAGTPTQTGMGQAATRTFDLGKM